MMIQLYRLKYTLWYVVECAGARESVVHSLAFYFILKIGAKEKIYLYVCVCVVRLSEVLVVVH